MNTVPDPAGEPMPVHNDEIVLLFRDLRTEIMHLSDKVGLIQVDVASISARDPTGRIERLETELKAEIHKLEDRQDERDKAQFAAEKKQSRAYGYLMGLVGAGGASGAALVKLAEKLIG